MRNLAYRRNVNVGGFHYLVATSSTHLYQRKSPEPGCPYHPYSSYVAIHNSVVQIIFAPNQIRKKTA